MENELESQLVSVYQVICEHLQPQTKALLRLVSKNLRVAVDEYIDKLVVDDDQLQKLGESAFQPTKLTINLRSHQEQPNWAGLQLAYVLRNLKTLVIRGGKLRSQLCQVSTLLN
jgi:hypothetical protein